MNASTSSDFRRALEKLEGLFRRQVVNGDQSKHCEYACGQFLSDFANAQNGAHGTAAAVRVLGKTDSSQKAGAAVVPGLIEFLRQRLAPNEGETADKHATNVIKLSEALYALAHVPAASGAKEALVQALAQALRGGMLCGQGWGYFIGQNDIAHLPTAYAVQALAIHGYPVEGPVEYIQQSLNARRLPTDDVYGDGDIFVQIACLHTLATMGPANNEQEGRLSREQLGDRFWAILRDVEPLLSTDSIEANIEYRGLEDENFYVRVPWQIYLIRCARLLPPRRAFASRAIQGRLAYIVQSVLSDRGFIYPHSGTQISSRSNAIVYDLLEDLETQGDPNLLRPFLLLDGLRRFFGGRWVRRLLLVGVSSLAIWIIIDWFRDPSRSISDLAPELLAAVILALLAAGRRRP